MTTNDSHTHIEQLRTHLLGTLAALRDRENPMEPDRARAVAQVAGVLVDTARVEVEYLRVTGNDVSNFIDGAKAPALPAPMAPAAEPPAITTTKTGSLDRSVPGRTVHQLRGD